MSNDPAYDLLTLLQKEYAPTGKEQAQLSEIYNQMFKDGKTSTEVLLGMSDILTDGLRYGNWPWTEIKKD